MITDQNSRFSGGGCIIWENKVEKNLYEYFKYCEEVGCDVWGLLRSMNSISGELMTDGVDGQKHFFQYCEIADVCRIQQLPDRLTETRQEYIDRTITYTACVLF